MEDFKEIFTVVVGTGVVSSYLTFLWQRRNAEEQQKQQYKELRYKCIILLMKALLEFEKYHKILISHKYDIKNKNDLIDLLRDE